jgi:hypothetical protein
MHVRQQRFADGLEDAVGALKSAGCNRRCALSQTAQFA